MTTNTVFFDNKSSASLVLFVLTHLEGTEPYLKDAE